MRNAKKLAPMLRQAFRRGIEAASVSQVQNPYVPGSHLHQAWISGWTALAQDGAADKGQPD